MDEALEKEMLALGKHVWETKQKRNVYLEMELKKSNAKVQQLENSISRELAFNAKLITELERFKNEKGTGKPSNRS